MQKPITFLMFAGQAEQAMNFYTSVFEKSGILNLTRFNAGEPGPEGSVKMASFSLMGQEYMCVDSPAKHDFGFTPAISFFVNCDSEAETDKLFQALSAEGKVRMPLGAYPFSPRFGWVQDRFGISWQLNLKKA